MQYEVDREEDGAGEPSIAEMTEKAIKILQKNSKGYFLFVEGSLQLKWSPLWNFHAHPPIYGEEIIAFVLQMNSRNYKKSREDKYILLVKSKCNTHWPQITDKSLLLLPLGYAWFFCQINVHPLLFCKRGNIIWTKLCIRIFQGHKRMLHVGHFFRFTEVAFAE